MVRQTRAASSVLLLRMRPVLRRDLGSAGPGAVGFGVPSVSTCQEVVVSDEVYPVKSNVAEGAHINSMELRDRKSNSGANRNQQVHSYQASGARESLRNLGKQSSN